MQPKSDPYRMVKFIGIILTIFTILATWIFGLSAMRVHVGDNTKHLNDLEIRVRAVEKNSERTNVLLQLINKKLDKIDQKLEHNNGR